MTRPRIADDFATIRGLMGGVAPVGNRAFWVRAALFAAPSPARSARLKRRSLRVLGGAPLNLIRFLGQLDCPYPKLLYDLRFNNGLRESAASFSRLASTMPGSREPGAVRPSSI